MEVMGQGFVKVNCLPSVRTGLYMGGLQHPHVKMQAQPSILC